MKDLALVVKYYGQKNGVDINFFDDVIIVNDPEGLRIEEWNIEDKLTQPTQEEFEVLETEAMAYYARKNKLAELDQKFNYERKNGHMICSFGVDIDANDDSLRNIGNLLLVMGEDDKEMFCDYNNQFHELTKQQIEKIQAEIIGHIRGLYSQKWSYRDKINTLTNAEEINSMVIEFI